MSSALPPRPSTGASPSGLAGRRTNSVRSTGSAAGGGGGVSPLPPRARSLSGASAGEGGGGLTNVHTTAAPSAMESSTASRGGGGGTIAGEGGDGPSSSSHIVAAMEASASTRAAFEGTHSMVNTQGAPALNVSAISAGGSPVGALRGRSASASSATVAGGGRTASVVAGSAPLLGNGERETTAEGLPLHTGINFSSNKSSYIFPNTTVAASNGGGGGGSFMNPHETMTAEDYAALGGTSAADAAALALSAAAPFVASAAWPESLHERVLRARLAISDLFDRSYERSAAASAQQSALLLSSTAANATAVGAAEAAAGGDLSSATTNTQNCSSASASGGALLSAAQGRAHMKLLRSKVVHVLHQLADSVRVDSAVSDELEAALRGSNVSQTLMTATAASASSSSHAARAKGSVAAAKAASAAAGPNGGVKGALGVLRALDGGTADGSTNQQQRILLQPIGGPHQHQRQQQQQLDPNARHDLIVANMRVKLSEKYREIEALKAFCLRKDAAIELVRTALLQDVINLKKDNIEMTTLAQNLQLALQREQTGGGGATAAGAVRAMRGAQQRAGGGGGGTDDSPAVQTPAVDGSQQTFLTATATSNGTASSNQQQQQQPYVITAAHTQQLKAAATREYLTVFDYLQLFGGDDPDPARQAEGALRIAERHHREVVQRLNLDTVAQCLLKDREIELLRRQIDHLNGEVINAQNKKYVPANAFLMYRLALMKAARYGGRAGNAAMALAVSLGQRAAEGPPKPSRPASATASAAAGTTEGVGGGETAEGASTEADATQAEDANPNPSHLWDAVAGAPYGVVLPEGIVVDGAGAPRTGEELEDDLVFVMRELDKKIAECGILSDKLEKERSDGRAKASTERSSLMREQQATQELTAQLEERETECAQLQETVATLQRALADAAADAGRGGGKVGAEEKSAAQRAAEMESVLRMNVELQSETIPRITKERDALGATVADLKATVEQLRAEAAAAAAEEAAAEAGAGGGGKGGGGQREVASLAKSNALMTRQIQRLEQEGRAAAMRLEEERERAEALAAEAAELRAAATLRATSSGNNLTALARKQSNMRRLSTFSDSSALTPTGGGAASEKEALLTVQLGDAEEQLLVLKEEREAGEEARRRMEQRIAVLEGHLKAAAEAEAADGGDTSATGGGASSTRELKGIVFTLQKENTALHDEKLSLTQRTDALEAKNLDLGAEIQSLKEQLRAEMARTALLSAPSAPDTLSTSLVGGGGGGGGGGKGPAKRKGGGADTTTSAAKAGATKASSSSSPPTTVAKGRGATRVRSPRQDLAASDSANAEATVEPNGDVTKSAAAARRASSASAASGRSGATVRRSVAEESAGMASSNRSTAPSSEKEKGGGKKTGATTTTTTTRGPILAASPLKTTPPPTSTASDNANSAPHQQQQASTTTAIPPPIAGLKRVTSAHHSSAAAGGGGGGGVYGSDDDDLHIRDDDGTGDDGGFDRRLSAAPNGANARLSASAARRLSSAAAVPSSASSASASASRRGKLPATMGDEDGSFQGTFFYGGDGDANQSNQQQAPAAEGAGSRPASSSVLFAGGGALRVGSRIGVMLSASSPPRPASGGGGSAGARPDSAVISRIPTPTAAGTATFPALSLSLGSGADGGTASVQIATPVGGFEGGSPAVTAMLRNQSAVEPPLSSLPQSAAAAVDVVDGEEDPNVSDIHSASAVGGGQRKGGSGAMDARSLAANASATTAPPPSTVDLLGGLPPPRTQQLSTAAAAAGRTSSIGSLASRPPSGRGVLNNNTTRPLPPSRAGSGAPVVSESRRSVLGERNGDFAVTKDKHHANRTASASARGSTSTVVYSGFSPTAAYDGAASRPPSSSAGGSMPPRPSSTAGGMSSGAKKGGGAALPPLMSSSSVVAAASGAAEEAPLQQRLVVECVDGSTQTDFAPSLLPPSSSSAAADAQSRDDSSATTINGQCVSLPDTARPSAAPSYTAAVIPTLHMHTSSAAQGGGQLSPTAVAKQRAMAVGNRGRVGESDGSDISEALVSGLAALVGPPSQHQIPAPTAGDYHRRYAVGSRFGALHHRQSAMGIYGPSEASTAAAAAAASSGPVTNIDGSAAAAGPTLFLSAEEAAAAADSVFAPSAVLQKYWAMQWVQRHSEQFEKYYRDILASRAEAALSSASATPGAVAAPREGRAASPSASPARKGPAVAASTAAAAAQASAQQRKQRAADRLAWMSMGSEGPMSPTKEGETVPSASTVADTNTAAVPVADSDPPIGDDEATRRLSLAQEATCIVAEEDPSRPLAAAIAQIEKRHGCEVASSSAVVPLPRPRSGRNSPTHTSLTTAAASSRPSSASAPLAFPPSVHVRTSSAGGASDDATVLSAAATPTNASVPPIIAAAASSSDTAKKTVAGPAATAKKLLRGGGFPLTAAARGDNSDKGRAASASSPQQHGEEQQQQQQSWRAVVRAAEISSQKADIALDEELRQRGRDRQSRQLALAAGGARARLLASSPERRPASGVVSPQTTESAERRPSFEEALPNIPFRDVASAVGPSQTAAFSASDAAKGGTAAKGSGGATGPTSSSLSVLAVPPPYASPSVAVVAGAEASPLSSPPQQLHNASSSAAAPRQRTIDARALAADVFHNDSLLPEDVNFERRVAAAVAARRVGGAAGAGDGDPNGGGVAGRRQQRQAAGGAAVTVRGVREKVQAQINVAKFMQTFPDLHPLPAQSPNSQAPVKGRRQ